MITANTDISFTLPNHYRGVMIITDSTGSRTGMYLMSATGSGSVVKIAIKESDLTITTATNQLTIAGSSASPRITFINIASAVSV